MLDANLLLLKRTCIVLVIGLIGHIGCGVRGDPVPPKIPAELGRGRPTYRGATEDLAFPNVPPVYAPTSEETKKQKEKEKESEKK